METQNMVESLLNQLNKNKLKRYGSLDPTGNFFLQGKNCDASSSVFFSPYVSWWNLIEVFVVFVICTFFCMLALIFFLS